MKRLDYYTVQDHSISVWSSTYKHMILSNLFDASSNQPTPTGHHALHCIKLYLFFPSTSVSPYSAASLVCHLFSAKKYFLSYLDSPSSQSFNTSKKHLNFNHDNLSVFLYYPSQISLPIGNPKTLSRYASFRPHGDDNAGPGLTRCP